jgi:RecA/RadA recombinase
MITVGNNGAIGFKCLHNSCQGKTWHDVRVLFEPDAYDKAERSQADDSRINEGWKEHKAKYAREIEIEYPDIEPEDDLFALEETKIEHEGFLTAKQINAIPDEIEDYIPTGIKMLDDRLHGLKRGMVTLVSGLRGGSKSTLLSNIALNALDAGYSVMAYSGELTNKNFMKWMYLQACGKTFVKQSQRYANYWFVPDEYKRRIAEWMGDRFMLYNNDYGNKYEELKKRMLAVIKEQKTDLVILDNLMILDIDGLDERACECAAG